MKIMICGKGGSGKSTITVLLARTLAAAGRKVWVVDADESNLCLHRLLGVEQPEILMDALGGRQGTRERLKQVAASAEADELFREDMRLSDIPGDCLAEVDGIHLVLMGKIKEFGEGCACMIGGIAKAILSRLKLEKDEVVLIDAEAGLEHFGRQVDRNCDLVLTIVDPTFESLQMAARARAIAASVGVPSQVILNKVDDTTRLIMEQELDASLIIAAIPKDDRLFLQSLKGEPLLAEIAEIGKACRFLLDYRKPVTLTMSL